ncbi:hypothetical protein FEM48_Zijuj09G0187600 [Ziziphus jujuba var. spinosa]|uniref:THH1/TOM1/TOM3 domain-containing protein n=1 Tax=Ziziphus jujuba var. spinosa TaxID=714518 RepID=A0A978UUP1_ZIZJJ|nr:hypothetical protein FEM48_Zijuj09G0187600 [Ziziphus jujuba var. spinosa]
MNMPTTVIPPHLLFLSTCPSSFPSTLFFSAKMVLSRKGLFVLKEAVDDSVGLFNWWKDIDESEEWQRGIYFTLCAAYGFVSLVALVQLLRIHLRVPEYGWTTQKVFHLMNFLVNGLRALIFGLYKNVFRIRPKARSLSTNKLRPVYYVTNGLVYFIQVCIWIFIRLSRSPAAVEAAKLFFSIISFCAALGFLLYGGRLFVMLRRFPIESRGRQKKIYEVGCVTGICCTCFLVRCFVLAFSAFDEDADVNVMDHPILNLLYYMASGRDTSISFGAFHPEKTPPKACFRPISPHKMKFELYTLLNEGLHHMSLALFSSLSYDFVHLSLTLKFIYLFSLCRHF